MRLVVDTNILVSFAIRPNRTFERIFDHVANHGVLLISDETLTELADVLTRDKFRRYLPMVDATNSCLLPCRVGPISFSRAITICSRWSSSRVFRLSHRPRSRAASTLCDCAKLTPRLTPPILPT